MNQILFVRKLSKYSIRFRHSSSLVSGSGGRGSLTAGRSSSTGWVGMVPFNRSFNFGFGLAGRVPSDIATGGSSVNR